MQCSHLVGWFPKTTCCWLHQGSSYLGMQTTHYQGPSSAQERELRRKAERPTQRGLFGLRTITHPSCLWPSYPFLHLSLSLRPIGKKISLISSWPNPSKVWDLVEGAKETALCLQLHFTHILCNMNSVHFGPFLTTGPLFRRIIVCQVFSPQVTKINICVYNLYYFLYLWIIYSGGAGWWLVLNPLYPPVFHSPVEVGCAVWWRAMLLHPLSQRALDSGCRLQVLPQQRVMDLLHPHRLPIFIVEKTRDN